MKIGFVCCIHSNFEALQAVGRDIDAQKCDKVYCLGDIVGYGTRPHECIEYVRERKWPSLIGNHEAAVLDPRRAESFTPLARYAIYYTMGAVTGDDRAWMSALPQTLEEADFQIFHASPVGPPYYERYILTVEAAVEAFALMKKPWLFIGHTHVSSAVFNSAPIAYSSEKLWKLDKKTQAILNVGSVGQPRDKDNRSCYAIFDTDTLQVEIRRVEYDIEKTAAEILSRGLPAKFAERLKIGA